MAKNEIRWRRGLEGTVSLLEIEKAWINLLLIKRGKIMEIWKFENFLPRRSWNREKLEEVFIEYASTDLNSKRREFFASNYCCNGVEQQQITIWNGVKRFTTYLRDIARGDRLAETVNKSVTQYSWRNTINKTRATIDQNLFESNQPIAHKSRIFITTSIWNYFKISFKSIHVRIFFPSRPLSRLPILEIRLRHRYQLISHHLSWESISFLVEETVVSSSLSRAFPCAAFNFRVARASRNVDRYRGS